MSSRCNWYMIERDRCKQLSLVLRRRCLWYLKMVLCATESVIRDWGRNALFIDGVSVKGRVSSVVEEYGVLVERKKPVRRHRMSIVRASVGGIWREAVGVWIKFRAKMMHLVVCMSLDVCYRCDQSGLYKHTGFCGVIWWLVRGDRGGTVVNLLAPEFFFFF